MAEMIEVLNPTAKGVFRERELAERPETLQAQPLGLLNNSKDNAAILLSRIGELLSQQLGVSGPVLKEKRRFPAAAGPAPDDILADLARCRAVVNAIAD